MLLLLLPLLQLEKRLAARDAEVHDLNGARAALAAQLEKLTHDSQYLRARAVQLRAQKRPKLGFAAALSLTVAT